jgi:IclR family pca regulon transcriptional regulator
VPRNCTEHRTDSDRPSCGNRLGAQARVILAGQRSGVRRAEKADGLWGSIWTREGLDRRTRSCVTHAVLTALGRHEEIAMHVRAAITNGLTAAEIAEVLLHTGAYAGVPAANAAFAIGQQVPAELGTIPPFSTLSRRTTMTTGGNDDGQRGTHYVQSLERGLAVIKAFDAENPQLTLSDVARLTGLTRAAARRFLLTLADLGDVRTDGKRFSLTAKVLELGYSYLSSMTLCEVAQPHLEQLSADVHESSSVSVLDGPDVVYIARVAASRIMTVSINIGTRFPAYATSMGHVLLAGLSAAELDAYLARTPLARLTANTITDQDTLRTTEKVRAQGYSIVDQELEEDLRSVAAAIRDRSGVIAAINISTHASRRSIESIRAELIPRLQTAAQRIEQDLTAAKPITRLG